MNFFRSLFAFGAISGILEAQVPNPLSITPTIPGQFQLSWLAENHRPYQMEAGPDLTTWAELGPVVVGTGTSQGMLVTATASKFFYRLRKGAMRSGFDAIEMSPTDDGTYNNPTDSAIAVPLGFALNFYGETFTTCYVNNNGNITFDNPLDTWNPITFQSSPRKMIAPFWADVDTQGDESDVVRFSNNSTVVETVDGRPAFGATYRNVGWYPAQDDKLNSFQVILISRSDISPGDFDIEFNYNQIHWEYGALSSSSARVGVANKNGVYVEYKGSGQTGAFLDTIPPSGTPNLVNGLIFQSLNSTVPGRIIFPVRGGQLVGIFSVSAGPDITPDEDAGATVQLNGAVSPTGLTGVTYSWSQISGPSFAEIPDPSSLTPTVILPLPGDYQFRLTATKPGDLSVRASDDVLVSHPGVYEVDAGGYYEPSSSALTLDQSVAISPTGVSLSILWAQESGEPVTFSDPSDLHSSVTLPGPGDYTFSMTVTTNHASPFVFTSYAYVSFPEPIENP